jgi:hypothetical protein
LKPPNGLTKEKKQPARSGESIPVLILTAPLGFQRLTRRCPRSTLKVVCLPEDYF